MVASAAVILLPPPASRRGESARAEEGIDRRRTAARTSAPTGEAAGFDPVNANAPPPREAGPPPGRARGRRSFADELVGESGKAPAEITFAAQRIAQERLGTGAHIEDWATAIDAYARAADTSAPPAGYAA
jgi:hypothetical protein